MFYHTKWLPARAVQSYVFDEDEQPTEGNIKVIFWGGRMGQVLAAGGKGPAMQSRMQLPRQLSI
jgi:hypothetical protein